MKRKQIPKMGKSGVYGLFVVILLIIILSLNVSAQEVCNNVDDDGNTYVDDGLSNCGCTESCSGTVNCNSYTYSSCPSGVCSPLSSCSHSSMSITNYCGGFLYLPSPEVQCNGESNNWCYWDDGIPACLPDMSNAPPSNVYCDEIYLGDCGTGCACESTYTGMYSMCNYNYECLQSGANPYDCSTFDFNDCDSYHGCSLNSGNFMAEQCSDGIDNDCNGLIDDCDDLDNDGHTTSSGGDCDDDISDDPAVCRNGNLVINHGFELGSGSTQSGLSNYWFANSLSSATINFHLDSSNSNSGLKSQKIIVSNHDSTPSSSYPGMKSTIVSIKSNTQYTVSAKVKGDITRGSFVLSAHVRNSAISNNFQCVETGCNGAGINTISSTVPNWITINKSFTTNNLAEVTQVYLFFSSPDGEGTVWIDDVELIEGYQRLDVQPITSADCSGVTSSCAVCINPSAQEIPYDFINNDCDADLDETNVYDISYDTIAVGGEWFVCNATGQAPQFGDLNLSNYLKNFQSPPDKTLPSGSNWCYNTPDVYNKTYFPQLFYQNEDYCKQVNYDETIYTEGCCMVINQILPYDNESFESSVDSEFQYLLGENQYSAGNCPVCYDINGVRVGEPPADWEDDAASTEVLKETWSIDPEYRGHWSFSCSDNGGFYCDNTSKLDEDENYYCLDSFARIGSNQSEVCCYNHAYSITNYTGLELWDVCNGFEGNPLLNCSVQGGETIPDPNAPNVDGISCDLPIQAANLLNNYICCKEGYREWDPYDLSPFKLNNSFLCYKEAGDSLIAECSYGSSFSNLHTDDPWNKVDGSNMFTEGSQLHTVQSFDKVDEPFVLDMIRKIILPASSHSFPAAGVEFWPEYDTLEFDILFTGVGTPDTIELMRKDIGVTEYPLGCGFSISDNINHNLSGISLSANNWYHVILDISVCGFDILNQTNYLKINISGSSNGEFIFIDNFVLNRKSDLGTNQGYDTRYCTGPFETWIPSLTSPIPIDFQTSAFRDYAPYMFACDSQMSYEWSGTRCCGSETTKDNYGEFYSDEWAGCFNGFKVESDEIVADSINYYLSTYNNLLYYDNFFACDYDYGNNLVESFDGTRTSIPLINPSNIIPTFEIIGSWFCSKDGNWLSMFDDGSTLAEGTGDETLGSVLLNDSEFWSCDTDYGYNEYDNTRKKIADDHVLNVTNIRGSYFCGFDNDRNWTPVFADNLTLELVNITDGVDARNGQTFLSPDHNSVPICSDSVTLSMFCHGEKNYDHAEVLSSSSDFCTFFNFGSGSWGTSSGIRTDEVFCYNKTNAPDRVLFNDSLFWSCDSDFGYNNYRPNVLKFTDEQTENQLSLRGSWFCYLNNSWLPQFSAGQTLANGINLTTSTTESVLFNNSNEWLSCDENIGTNDMSTDLIIQDSLIENKFKINDQWFCGLDGKWNLTFTEGQTLAQGNKLVNDDTEAILFNDSLFWSCDRDLGNNAYRTNVKIISPSQIYNQLVLRGPMFCNLNGKWNNTFADDTTLEVGSEVFIPKKDFFFGPKRNNKIVCSDTNNHSINQFCIEEGYEFGSPITVPTGGNACSNYTGSDWVNGVGGYPSKIVCYDNSVSMSDRVMFNDSLFWSCDADFGNNNYRDTTSVFDNTQIINQLDFKGSKFCYLNKSWIPQIIPNQTLAQGVDVFNSITESILFNSSSEWLSCDENIGQNDISRDLIIDVGLIENKFEINDGWFCNLDGKWNNTFAEDETLASGTGVVNAQTEAILFNDSLFWSCDVDFGNNNYRDTTPVFDNTHTEDQFTLRASWFCNYNNKWTSSFEDNMTLAEGLNVENSITKSILFKDGEFWSCNNDLGVNDYSGNPIIESDHIKNYFDTKGSYFCDINKEWTPLADYPPTRLIASKLLDIAKTSGLDYSLHCNGDDSLNLLTSPEADSGLFGTLVSTENFCVLNINDENILIGVVLEEVNIDNYLNHNLKSFYPMNDEESSTTYTCDDALDETTTNTFFTICEETGNRLNVSYNKPFNVVIFSLEEPRFTGIVGFFANMWDSLKTTFSKLFGNYAAVTYSLPQNSELAEFEELFIKTQGDLEIKALKVNKTLVVDYYNFKSDISFLRDLTDQWKGTSDINTDYALGCNYNQRLMLEGTDLNTLNWNYLTSNLRLHDVAGAKLNGECNYEVVSNQNDCTTNANLTNCCHYYMPSIINRCACDTSDTTLDCGIMSSIYSFSNAYTGDYCYDLATGPSFPDGCSSPTAGCASGNCGVKYELTI